MRDRDEAGGARSKAIASKAPNDVGHRHGQGRFTTPEGCCVAAPSGTNICGCMPSPSGLTSAAARRWLEQVLPIPATEAHKRGVEESYHADLSGMNVRWCSTAGALGHGRMMMLSCLPLALLRQRKGCCHMSDKAAPTYPKHIYCMQRCSR